ncbi:xanthine dehydrogenase accessory protein XdhC [Stagnihabitans tardus]|uniref:Xanthine dehydrogenase accessory protein XdhC n=1 Tax=Stagnihabitans tardus TaxID=2699202 RepID=A0AAE4YBH3_9RHOB|nr:xanthine dehydrogenase accessory protein XdhC [Stagnihabitans tardus]NBZ88622.1 xanthine dehydrogenase accessory protein XdhC [Stagnihabitans tardus]
MLDLTALQDALREGPVTRVLIAAHDGSSPREPGTSMLVTPTRTHGTIGGGALEHQATQAARRHLGPPQVSRIPLGPALGQCCGGAVTLVTETLAELPKGPLHAVSLDGSPMPLAVKRLMAQARAQGALPETQILQGWLIDPIAPPRIPVWLWGAGHVGRAIAATLSPLPNLGITWIDIAQDRFPRQPNTTQLPVPDPATAVTLAPREAHHLIVTFSHQLDLELCHRLLAHGFASCGLIGSETKWARFRSRLQALGQDPTAITCPIGDPRLGKHPQAIAIGVAHQLMRTLLTRASSPFTLAQISHGGPGV